MESNQVFHELRNNILLSINTCFPARVESFDGTNATIQPLFKVKYYGQDARQLPIIQGVPTLKQRYRVNGSIPQVYEPVLQKGDIVLCVCAQRSLDDAMGGRVYGPGKSRVLDIQDAVIVGVM